MKEVFEPVKVLAGRWGFKSPYKAEPVQSNQVVLLIRYMFWMKITTLPFRRWHIIAVFFMSVWIMGTTEAHTVWLNTTPN